jgi:hypothetical protein
LSPTRIREHPLDVLAAEDDADLLGEVREHRGREGVPMLREPREEAIERELRDEAEPADVLLPEEQVPFTG